MHKHLPTGTVTFLFTDIEGSTKLAQERPDTWETLRKRHDAILRNAIKFQNGYVFRIVGDAFSAAFHTAEDALPAALESNENLLRNLGKVHPSKCGWVSTRVKQKAKMMVSTSDT